MKAGIKRVSVVFCLIFCVTMVTQTIPAQAAGEHLNFKSITMYAGENGGIALVTSSGGFASGKCKWKVADKEILRLHESKTSDLLFTGAKKGRTTITCIKGGKKYTCKVTVKTYLKKKDVKVLKSYKNAEGQKVQLIRVKNSTKAKRNISLYQKEGDVMHTCFAVPSGKYAYFIRSTAYDNIVSVYRINAKVGMNTDANPNKNVNAKVKASIRVGKNNRCKITYKNSYKNYVHIHAVYVIFDENGKPIHMNYDSDSVAPKDKSSHGFDCPGDTKAASAKIYINAVSY